jgi:ubiquitin-conjugating enzyme E2 M
VSELSLPKNIRIDFPDPDDLLNFRLTIQPDEGTLSDGPCALGPTPLTAHGPWPPGGGHTGMYKGGSFDFTFKIKENYPHEPPKVRCTNKARAAAGRAPIQSPAADKPPPHTNARTHIHPTTHARSHACAPFLRPVCAAGGQIYHPNIDMEGAVCLNILRDEWMPVLSIQSVVYGLQYLFLVRAPHPLQGRPAPRSYARLRLNLYCFARCVCVCGGGGNGIGPQCG